MNYQSFFKQPIIWAVLIAILVMLVVGIDVAQPGVFRWPHVKTLGVTEPFRPPALLYADDNTIIWQPGTANTPLVAQSLDTDVTTGILPYPDVKPERWQAAPANGDAYHIIWVEHDDRLRSALIDATGETQRGPITLAFRAGRDFASAALPDRSVLVVWRNPATHKVTAQIIDPLGRPNASSLATLNSAEQMAVAVDQVGTLHFAWIETGLSGQRTIYYQPTARDQIVWDSSVPVHTLDLAPTESITTLMIGLDQTHVYLVWSVITAAQPDREHVYTLTFPFDQPGESQIGEIRLPPKASAYKTVSADTGAFNLDRVRRLATESEQAAALRWPIIADGQHTILPLAITYHTSDGWRPAVIYYQDGTALGYQTIADHPANAGPPAITADPAGVIFAAWSGLDGVTPILYTATLTDQGLISSSEDRWWVALVAGAIAGAAVWVSGRYLRSRPDSSV